MSKGSTTFKESSMKRFKPLFWRRRNKSSMFSRKKSFQKIELPNLNVKQLTTNNLWIIMVATLMNSQRTTKNYKYNINISVKSLKRQKNELKIMQNRAKINMRNLVENFLTHRWSSNRNQTKFSCRKKKKNKTYRDFIALNYKKFKTKGCTRLW